MPESIGPQSGATPAHARSAAERDGAPRLPQGWGRVRGWLARVLLRLAAYPGIVARTFLDRVLWPLELSLRGVRVGRGLVLNGRPIMRLAPGGDIRIGDHVKLLSRRFSNPFTVRTPCALTLLSPGARITIGDDCALTGTVIVATGSVQLGDRVLFGPNCVVTDTDGHPLLPEDRRLDRNRRNMRPVVIGNDVFIGAHAILLKGTVLADGCVVAAGAIVQGRFRPRSVIVGNPARTAFVMAMPSAE